MKYLICLCLSAAAFADEVRFTHAVRVRDRVHRAPTVRDSAFDYVYFLSDDGQTTARAWCGWTWSLVYSVSLEISPRPYFEVDDVGPAIVLKKSGVPHCLHELRRLDAVSAERPLIIRDGSLASEF